MKKIFSFLFFLTTLSSLNADEKTIPEWNQCTKTYINQNQVHFYDHHIFIHFGENQWIRTSGVFVDSEGLYINSFKPIDEKSLSWTCDNCGKYNEGYRDVCKKCGEPKPYDDYYDHRKK